MSQTVKFNNLSLTLVGRKLLVDTFAPGFRVVSNEFKDISLEDFKGKIKIIHSFPSLDTEVCDLQVKEFNKRAIMLSDDVEILGVSKDLPFAQKRFCDQFSIDKITILSDYKTSSFGINYGLLIKEINLLARAALVLDKDDVIRYIQISGDITRSLNYEELFQKLSEIIKKPSLGKKASLFPQKCLPCEGKVKPLSKDEATDLLKSLNGWELIEGKKIQKEFKFEDFIRAKYFLDLLSVIAEEEGHHPIFILNFNRLKVTLTTHFIGALSENDVIMAKIIDEIES